MTFYVEKVKRKKVWRYRIVKDTTRNGIRHRTYTTLPVGTTKANAERICNQMALESEFGGYLTKERLSFGEYVEGIYFVKYTNYLSATTKRHYEQMYYVDDGIKEHLGELSLSEITTEVLQDLVNDYAAKGRAPKTIRNILSFISVVLKQAMTDNYLRRQDKTPCGYVRLPKLQEKEGNAYTLEQVRLIMQRAEDTDNLNVQLLIALCCLAGGLRRSELGGLKWEDITLNEKEAYIHIQRAVVQGQGGLVEKETKTKAGKRIIPIKIGGTVYRVLQKARKQQMKLRLLGDDFEGDNHVFILYQYPYRPMTPERIYKTFKRFMQKECPELPCYRLHDLRHTYFTICSNIEGFSELSLTGTGGHSTIKSSKRYQHAMMDKMRTDMEKLEEAFGATGFAVNG